MKHLVLFIAMGVAVTGCGTKPADQSASVTSAPAPSARSEAEPDWVAVLTAGPLKCTGGTGAIRVRASRDGALFAQFGPRFRYNGTWRVAGPNAWGRELSGPSEFPYEEQPVELVDSRTIRIRGTDNTWECQPS